MQRSDLQRDDRKHQSDDNDGEVDILSVVDRFIFSIIPCEMALAHKVIRSRFKSMRRPLTFDEQCSRDVRAIYLSKDGPQYPPATEVGMLLTEVTGRIGKNTLFVSSVSDGHWTLLTGISNTILGVHLVIETSRLDIKYPRNAVTAIENGERIRVVYAMRDEPSWHFCSFGKPLEFEDVTHYNAQIKKKRLTPAIIAGYLKDIAYGSLRRSFWIDDSTQARVLATPGFRLWKPASNFVDR